ncbi:unnamed protein product [Rotaria sordida]|uniref:Uncharacterized protein n=1 Tax=Rotaria sordida TaxID=392033 RepID=A0A819ZTL0_9BILA|nr:unnamed protein product [Rotaria sordida]
MTFYNIKTKSSEYQPINSNMMKRYLTNTDKSVFNLKWENRDVAQQHSQRSRSQSQHDINKEKETPRKHSDTHHHKEQPELNYESTKTENPNTTYQARPAPTANYYPYAYPPMPVDEQPVVLPQPVKQRNTNRTITRTRQSDKSINLVRNNGKLKIEHHYVDSPAEAQRLIAKLHRQGFVETGIYTPAVDSNSNKN